MNKMMLKWVTIIVTALAIVSCGENKPSSQLPEKVTVKIDEEDVFAKIQVDLKVKNLEKEFNDAKSQEDIARILKNNPKFVKEYLEIPNAWNEKEFVKQIYELYSHPEMKKFIAENQKFYGDYNILKADLTNVFKHIKYYYPNYYVPEINTVVSGFRFDRDLAFNDSLVVCSVDYFLGNKASFRPQLHGYILERYEYRFMVPIITLAISSKYNQHNPKDETMLATMIHYGKAHYFLERMMPELPDSTNIQYNSTDMNEVTNNVDVIWAHFIQNKLLFDSNHKTIQRYCGETPKVSVIGDNCPGRIGRWLGWQIVRKYMQENPNVTLQQLMENPDAQDIFKKSKFKINIKG